MELLPSVLHDVFIGQLSKQFYYILLISIAGSLLINIIAFSLSFWSMYFIGGSKARFITFNAGLILLFSLSISIKAIIINNIPSISSELKSIMLYFSHLTPLYVVFYSFVLLQHDRSVILTLRNYNTSLAKIYLTYGKSMKFFSLTMFLFGTIYISFDDVKKIFDSRLFGYLDLVKKYEMHHSIINVDPYIFTAITGSPVLLILSVLFLFIIINSKKVGQKSFCNTNDGGFVEYYNGTTKSIRVSVFKSINKFVFKIKNESIVFFMVISPIIIYISFLIGFAIELDLFIEVIKNSNMIYESLMAVKSVFITAIFIASIYFILILLEPIRSKNFRNLVLFLFVLSLFPPTILGYASSGINEIFFLGINSRLLVSYTFVFGIFTSFFYLIIKNEYNDFFHLIENRNIDPVKKLLVKFKIYKGALILSTMIVSILILNDSQVVYHSNITDAQDKSLSFELFKSLSSASENEEINIISKKLLLANFIILLIGPFVELLIEILRSIKRIVWNLSE